MNTEYPQLESLQERIESYHPTARIIFDILKDTRKCFLMKKWNVYTLNDMSSGSFLIGDDKINLLIEFIDAVQLSFIEKKPMNFKVGKIDKTVLYNFNEKIINIQPLSDDYIQDLLQVFPYYFTPPLLISTILKNVLPDDNKMYHSIFVKLGKTPEPEPIVPPSLNIEKIVTNILDNAQVNQNNQEEAENIKALFTMMYDKSSFYKKHISEQALTQTIVNYTKNRLQVFENLKNNKFEESIFTLVKSFIPQENWRDISCYLPSYPKKTRSEKNMFEIADIITINVNMYKEPIYNKYDNITNEQELNRMLSTVIGVFNKNKSQSIESIIINNDSTSEAVKLFISGKNINNQLFNNELMNNELVLNLLEGLDNLIEAYDSLMLGSKTPLMPEYSKDIDYLEKLSHSFWINMKINEVKKESPERTQVRKI